jgi:hypothetical protein
MEPRILKVLKTRPTLALLVILMIIASAPIATAQECSTPNWTVFATGLTNPRNIQVGPNGDLYVAEAGIGGDLSTTCGPVDNFFTTAGQYKGGFTGRISRIRPDGTRETVASGLPSFYDQVTFDSLGVSDLAWIGNTLYALIEGGGCTRGFPNDPAGVVRIEKDGSYTYVANLTAFIRNNPVIVEPLCGPFGDCEPDGVPHSMLVDGNHLLVVETNHNSVLRVDPSNGEIVRLYDLSIEDPAPIILARKGNDFYLAGFDGLIQTFDRSGSPVSSFDSGYSAIVNMSVYQNNIHLLETFAPETPWTPESGRVVRRNRDGSRDIVACGLNFPIGMVRKGNDLYVSINSFGNGPVEGLGQIVRISLNGQGGE